MRASSSATTLLLALLIGVAGQTLPIGLAQAVQGPDFWVNGSSANYQTYPITIQSSTTGTVSVQVSSQSHFAGTIVGSIDPKLKCANSKPVPMCATIDPASITLKNGDYSIFTVYIPTTPNTATTSIVPTLVRFNMTNTNSATGVINQKTMDILVTIVPFLAPDYGVYTSGGLPTIKVSPASSGSSTVMVTSFNGFSGTIGLSATISTPGLTTAINPNQFTLTPGETATATVNVTAPSTQSYGTSVLVVNANGPSGNHQTILGVHVNPYYNMTVDPSPITIVLGTTAAATLTVYTNGFLNRLVFNITGMPYGLSARLRDPSFQVSKNTRLNSTMIELSAFQTMTSGDYNLVLNGMIINATGTDKAYSSKTMTITIIVSTSPTTGRPTTDDNRTVTTPSSNLNNLLIIALVGIAATIGVVTAVLRRQGVRRSKRPGPTGKPPSPKSSPPSGSKTEP